jgi:thiamine-phosphate pyrophosphorylase
MKCCAVAIFAMVEALPVRALEAQRLPAPLLVITDRRQARRPLAEIAAAVLAGGGRWLAVREKDLPPAAQAALAAELARLAAPHGACVILHGAPELAAAAGLAAVHLPAGGDVAGARRVLGPDAWIGISTHSAAELARAAAAGADGALLAPVFASASKPGYGPALGPAGLAALIRGARLPVLALGGIATPAQAAACQAAGAAGIAVMGAMMRAADPAGLTRDLVAALR